MGTNEKQIEWMRWSFFGVVLVFYVIITGLTVIALFTSLVQVDPQFKKLLFGAFILETGGAFFGLYYTLFGFTAEGKREPLPTNLIQNVDVVTESPLGIPVDLTKIVTQASLFDSYMSMLYGYAATNDFKQYFEPSMSVFLAKGGMNPHGFTPNAVLSIERNPLGLLNQTLADYARDTFSQVDQALQITGERQARIGTDQAVTWYHFRKPLSTEDNPERTVDLLQYQKIVVAGDLMGIVTVTYGIKSDPDHIRILQQLVSQFGVKTTSNVDT